VSVTTTLDVGPRPFLTAEWRDLAILNFEADAGILRRLVPAGTELDDWRGRTLVSVVGFLFLNTRVLGVPIPLHRNFEEVNLRFYVRRRGPEGWRRGVVFVKELVPRIAIALTARLVYGENYVAVPMKHRIDVETGRDHLVRRVVYSWMVKGHENRIQMSVQGNAHDAESGTEEEFVTVHHWGYARRRNGSTLEYRVEHPQWRVWDATDAYLECDASHLYGDAFAECLEAPPTSAFLADGSAVTVCKGRPLSVRGEP
jgi:uncharacterized protein